MASWTETQPISFTPYVGVDENVYSQVGLMKQQQYDQGVQKIQGYVDNISGINAVRDIDKQYIQTKVNDVVSQLNNISGADWSNKQLLNQAGSLASSLGRDVNIQAAQISSDRIRQLQASQKELKAKSPEKYTPQAEYWDNQEVAKYINSNELGSSYNGPTQATPYLSYHDDLGKMLKELSPEVQYKLDNSGNFQYYLDKNSTVSPVKIKQAVETFFNSRPEYQKSLQMDAMYSFKDYSPEDIYTRIGNLEERISSTYDSAVTQLKTMNKSYEEQIKADPNNYDLITKLRKDIADNEAIVKEYESAKVKNISALRDPKNLNSVKYELFKDNVFANAISTYQKDIHDLVKNEDLIRKEDKFLEYIKAGLNPETGAPLTPDSPYYTSYIRAKKSNSNKEGGSSDTEFSEDSMVVSQPDKSFNTSLNDAQITQLETSMNDLNSKLRSQYPDYDQKAFDAYKAEQERKIESGEKADPNYLDYKKRLQPISVELGALKQLKKDAANKAIQEVPLNSIGKIEIDGVKVRNPNGSVSTKISIDPEKHAGFLTKMERINDAIEQEAASIFLDYTTKNVKSEIMSPTGAMYNQAKSKVLSKYSNDADLGIISEIVNKNKIGVILNPYKDVLRKRVDVENKYLETAGKEFSPRLYTFEGKKEELDNWKRKISEAHRENKQEDVDYTKIDPVGVWKQLDGTTQVRYQINGETFDVQMPIDKEVLPNQDPYAWLHKVVETTGFTPKEGPGVLTSDNGIARYYISKNPWGGGYDAYILEGNNPIKIVPRINPEDPNSTSMSFRTPGEIYERMNVISSKTNPVTGKQFTRDEVNYYLTHDSDEFLQYMTKKLNN